MAVGSPAVKMFIDTSQHKRVSEDEKILMTTPEKNSIFDLNTSVDISHLDTPGTVTKKLKSILKKPLEESSSIQVKKDIRLMFTLPTKNSIHYYNQDESIEKGNESDEPYGDAFQFSRQKSSPFQIRAKVEKPWNSLVDDKEVNHSFDRADTPLSPSTKKIFKKELETMKIDEYEQKFADLSHQLEFHKAFSEKLENRNKSMENALSLWVAYSNDKEQHLISTLKSSELKINKLTNRVKKLRNENKELQKKMEEEVSLHNFSIGVEFDIARVAGINDTSYLCLNLNQSLETSIQSMASEEFERELATRLHEYFALHQPVKAKVPNFDKLVKPVMDEPILDSQSLNEFLLEITYLPVRAPKKRVILKEKDDVKMKASVNQLLSELKQHEEAYEAQRKAFDLQAFKDRETLKVLAQQLKSGDKDLSEILFQTKKAAEDREENHKRALEKMKERMAEATQNYEDALSRVEKLNLRVNLYKSMAENRPIDYGDAPQGEVALVFTDIQDSTKLWEHDQEAMQSAVMIHNRVMREAILEFNGYEVKTEGDAFMISFESVRAAVECCSAVQLRLLEETWPEGLIPEYFVPESIQEVRDEEDNILFRGLRVRMGIHFGSPVCKVDSTTGRMDYFGPVVNRAARVSGKAKGGQILVSDSVWNQIRENLDMEGVGTLWSNRVGTTQLRGMEDKPEVIWSILPHRLHKRETLKKRTAAGQRQLLEAERAKYTGKVKELVIVKKTMGNKISSLLNQISDRKEEIENWRMKSIKYQKQFLLTKTRLKKVEQQYRVLEAQKVVEVPVSSNVQPSASPKSVESSPSNKVKGKFHSLAIETEIENHNQTVHKSFDSMTPMSSKSGRTVKSMKSMKSSKSVKTTKSTKSIKKTKKKKKRRRRGSMTPKKQLSPRTEEKKNHKKELKQLQEEIKKLNEKLLELDSIQNDTNSLATGDDFLLGYDDSHFSSKKMKFIESPKNDTEKLMNKLIQKPLNVVRLKDMIQRYSDSNLFAYQLKQQSKKDRKKIEDLMNNSIEDGDNNIIMDMMDKNEKSNIILNKNESEEKVKKDKDKNRNSSLDILAAINTTAKSTEYENRPKKEISSPSSSEELMKRYQVVFEDDEPFLVLDGEQELPKELKTKSNIQIASFQLLDNNLVYHPNVKGNPRIVPTPVAIKNRQLKYHKMVLKHHLENHMKNAQSLEKVVEENQNQYVKVYEEDDSDSEFSFDFVNDIAPRNVLSPKSIPASNYTSACVSPNSVFSPQDALPGDDKSQDDEDASQNNDDFVLKNKDKIEELLSKKTDDEPEDLGSTEVLNDEDKLTALLNAPIEVNKSPDSFPENVEKSKGRINKIIVEQVREENVKKFAAPRKVDAGIQTHTFGKINIDVVENSPRPPSDTAPVSPSQGGSGHYIRVIDELRSHNQDLIREKQNLVKEIQIQSTRCDALSKRIDVMLKSQSLKEEKSLRTTKELFNLSQSDVRELKKIEKQIARQKFNKEYSNVHDQYKKRNSLEFNYQSKFKEYDEFLSTVPKMAYKNAVPPSPEHQEFVPIVKRPQFTRSANARAALNNVNIHRLPKKKPSILTSPHIKQVPNLKAPPSSNFHHYLEPLPDSNRLPILP